MTRPTAASYGLDKRLGLLPIGFRPEQQFGRSRWIRIEDGRSLVVKDDLKPARFLKPIQTGNQFPLGLKHGATAVSFHTGGAVKNIDEL